MINVAVGIITNIQQQVLLTRRPLHVEGGGLWEFPGGKCEPEETLLAALTRELQEEIGITVQAATPLLMVPYNYGHKHVVLHAFHVHTFSGEPMIREGQLAMCWVDKALLADYQMPAANGPIKAAVMELGVS